MSDITVNTFPVTPRIRWALTFGCVCVIAGYCVAAMVKPDPRGFGTHQQFGFPPCSFQEIFGVICPSCGGTTSVAHFVRGQWIGSIQANTSVFCLALLGLLYLPWSVVSIRRGSLWGVAVPSHFILTILITLSSIALAQWGWRLSN